MTSLVLRARAPWTSVTRVRGRLRIGGGLLTFAIITVVALGAPLVAPYGPLEPIGRPFQPPSARTLFGTDDVGHDVFSRVLYGTRQSWASSLVVVLVGVAVGLLIGAVAGLGPRWLDEILMRVTDAFLAIPAILVAIAVAAALGPSLVHALVAISLVWWPYYARIVRGEARALRQRPHVEAAVASGISRHRVVVRHVLPGMASTLVVAASLDIGYVVLTLAGLSFLGLGAAPPTPELGAMAAQGLSYFLTAWWIPIFPALAIAVITFAANVAGDAVAARAGGGR